MAWRRCEKCGYSFVTGMNDEACPHLIPANAVQSFDAGPEDFPGTDEGSHYMSQTAAVTPLEDFRRIKAEGQHLRIGNRRDIVAMLREMIEGARNVKWKVERPMIDDGVTADGEDNFQPGPKIYIRIELDV